MQCRDGGWGTFDKDNSKNILTKLPSAVHNAMIDPPTANITAGVLECLADCGHDISAPPVPKALALLQRKQKADGSWGVQLYLRDVARSKGPGGYR